MSYDFSKQKEMLKVTIDLLREFSIYDKTALGGGTALAYSWNHRYSTDIDIFIYDKNKEHIKDIRPINWSPELYQKFIHIGYKDSFKLHPIYTEFEIDEECKIQLFDKKGFTNDTPYKKTSIWNLEINIETVEEILAKKIFYRGHKNNARDIFDIAVATNRNPKVLLDILNSDDRFAEKFIILEEALEKINHNEDEMQDYNKEIEKMNPSFDYSFLSNNAPLYLHEIIQQLNYLTSLDINIDDSEMKAIENSVYEELSFSLSNKIEETNEEIKKENTCVQRPSL